MAEKALQAPQVQTRRIKVTGYTPEPHQRAVHSLLDNARGTGRIVVVKAKRQVGKSLLIENELLRFSLTNPKTFSYAVSPTLAQARKLFKDMSDVLEGTGLMKSANATLLEIFLINKSRITFRSSEQGDYLRGYTSDFTAIDEGAYIPDSTYLTIFPWQDARRAPLLICSTPRLKQGMYYDLWVKGLNHDGNICSVDWNDYDLSKFLSPERLEQYRKIYPKNQFLTEYLGLFSDGDGMTFDGIRNCIGEADGYRDLYVGIDWGTGKGEDYTALTMFNERGEMVTIDYFNDLGTFPQVERIISGLLPYRNFIRCIQAENNSIGSPMIDLLKKELKERKETGLLKKIVEFNTSNSSKASLVSQTQVGFERKEIKILNDSVLIEQLAAYEATYNAKTGSVSYNGASGTHDDLVISTMLAYDALKKNKVRGSYIIR